MWLPLQEKHPKKSPHMLFPSAQTEWGTTCVPVFILFMCILYTHTALLVYIPIRYTDGGIYKR